MVPIKTEDNLKKFNKLDDERIKYYRDKASDFKNNSTPSTSK